MYNVAILVELAFNKNHSNYYYQVFLIKFE